ncbi:PEPxxWA-CTERM sorting domain-containing protein [Altererythrobacter salegens]|uniref:PEPxxWA-CTERM sorting domain-containing protein n=1 Tax=Croceibacterium salegens TaxID=1737568 RepID=A0A6I4SXW9_9SPHN|nr:FxDxF family PEP-CTERM protein [Croceibacterium salegens]MXO59706.1 PEPxxWA-CTERM sorting domain-containing protein [Croceibacterium salegens]
MKRLASLAALAVSISFCPNANAATVISFDFGPGNPAGTFQSGIGPLNQVSCDLGPTGCAGIFTASGTFAANPGWQLVGAALTTGPATAASNNINFTSATLNGIPFAFFSPDGGISEFGTIPPVMMQAINILNVAGYTGGRGSFAGTLSFGKVVREPELPVPEPATWTMMIVGFAVLGFAMRRRKDAKAGRRIRLSYT